MKPIGVALPGVRMRKPVTKLEPIAGGDGEFAYSTWLVLGAWLVFQGGEGIVRATHDDGTLSGCLVGALRVAVGVLLLRTAHKAARWWDELRGSAVRAMSVVLVILLFGVPLFVVLAHSAIIMAGGAQADDLYRRHVTRLVLVAAAYMPATAWAGWRSKRRATKVDGE